MSRSRRFHVLASLSVLLLGSGCFPRLAVPGPPPPPTPSSPRPVCSVALATPDMGATLSTRRVGADRIEAVWDFGWQDCPEASRYHLYVIGPEALNPIVDNNDLRSATYQYRRTSFGYPNPVGWRWKVRAFVDGRWGEWSEERTFNVAQPRRIATSCSIRLAKPANGTRLSQRRLGGNKSELVWNFGWYDCPEAERYHLYVIGPGALNPIVDDANVHSATYQLRKESYGITTLNGWRWKVRAFVDGKWGEWSEERTFDVAPPQ